MKRLTQTMEGACHECGCTQDMACRGGCAWVDKAQTVCSACIRPFLLVTTQEDFLERLSRVRSQRLLEVLTAEMDGRIKIQIALVGAVATRLRKLQRQAQLDWRPA